LTALPVKTTIAFAETGDRMTAGHYLLRFIDRVLSLHVEDDVPMSKYFPKTHFQNERTVVKSHLSWMALHFLLRLIFTLLGSLT
jgi:hypothetical protein